MHLDRSNVIKLLGFASAHFLAISYLLLIPYAISKQGDFVHLWVGGRAAATTAGTGLYNPELHFRLLEATGYPLQQFWGEANRALGAFYYPPPAALWYAVLGIFPLEQAQALQAVATWVLVILSGYLLSRLTNGRLSVSWGITALFLSPPVFASFGLGQNGVMTLALVLLGLFLEKQNKSFASGLVLGALVYKPTWLLSILWYPFLKRDWRMVWGLFTGVSGLCLISASGFGVASFHEYLRMVPQLLSLHEFAGYSSETQFSYAALVRTLIPEATAAEIVQIALCGAVLGISVLLLRKGRRAKDAALFSTTLLAATLLTPHLHYYDLGLAFAGLLLFLPTLSHLQVRWRKGVSAVFCSTLLAFFLPSGYGAYVLWTLIPVSYGVMAMYILQRREPSVDEVQTID